MSGGGGSADAQSSLNSPVFSPEYQRKGWGLRQWLLLALALVPLVMLAVWAAVGA